MKNGDERYKKIALILLEVLVVAILAIVVEFFYFDFYKWNFRIPVTYNGGDAFAGIAGMKMRMLGDGNRLGWPFHEDLSAYSPVFNRMSLIGSRIIDLYVDDFIVGQNLFLFFIPSINVLSCYFVFRNMGIKRCLSFLGALIFGFCPYVQMRIFQHQDLVAVECIPIVFMLCFWLLEDEKFALPCKSYLKYSRNILLLAFGWMIANNGIVYYPFFSCFIILITGIVIAIQRKNVKKLLPSIIVILNIVLWLAIGFIPSIRGIFANRSDVSTNGAVRDASRAIVYGLDIRSLLLSPNGFGSKSIKSLYSYLLETQYEQYYAYLGIVGIIGFIILLLFLLRESNSDSKSYKRIALLSKINIMLILLGTAYGIGVIVAIFIPFIASYNRVSIFMLFACILSVLIMLNDKTDCRCGKKRYLIMTLAIAILLLGLIEQRKSYKYFNEELLVNNTIRLEQDRRFFAALEQEAGDGAMVYMLPYMKSFENNGVGKINDYEMYRGYMNTNTIKWNYGAINGGVNDTWNKYTSELEPEQMIEELKDKGFAGVYINLDGYEYDEGLILLNEIIDSLKIESILMHENEKIVYIPLM